MSEPKKKYGFTQFANYLQTQVKINEEKCFKFERNVKQYKEICIVLISDDISLIFLCTDYSSITNYIKSTLQFTKWHSALHPWQSFLLGVTDCESCKKDLTKSKKKDFRRLIKQKWQAAIHFHKEKKGNRV